MHSKLYQTRIMVMHKLCIDIHEYRIKLLLPILQLVQSFPFRYFQPVPQKPKSEQ